MRFVSRFYILLLERWGPVERVNNKDNNRDNKKKKIRTRDKQKSKLLSYSNPDKNV